MQPHPDGLIKTCEQVWRDSNRATEQERGRGREAVSIYTPTPTFQNVPLYTSGLGLTATAHTPGHPMPWMECTERVQNPSGSSVNTEKYLKPYSHPISLSCLSALPRSTVWWLRKCHTLAGTVCHYVPDQWHPASSWGSRSSLAGLHHLGFVIISTSSGGR